MADTPAPKTKGPGKKVGGLKTWQWGLVGVGAYGAYYLYKQHQNNLASTTTPATTDATGTTGGSVTPSSGSGLYYTTQAPATTTEGYLTLSGFANGIAAQLASVPGTKFTRQQINQAVNQYLNNQPITNSALANQISNVVSYTNELGAKALSQGGLVKPVQYATNVVTTTHTPSEAVNRAATAAVEQVTHIVTQQSRAATVPATGTPSSRATVKPKVAPASAGGPPLLPGVATAAAMAPAAAAVPATKKGGGVGFIPAMQPFGLNPVRDAGVFVQDSVLGVANVTKVAAQGVNRVLSGFISGLGL